MKTKGFGKSTITMTNFDNLIGEAMYLMNLGVDTKNEEHKRVFLQVKACEEEVLRRCRFGHQLIFVANTF